MAEPIGIGKAKRSKAEVDYHPAGGTETRRCGLCTMFRKPSSCTDVAGEIAPEGVCKIFYRRR